MQFSNVSMLLSAHTAAAFCAAPLPELLLPVMLLALPVRRVACAPDDDDAPCADGAFGTALRLRDAAAEVADACPALPLAAALAVADDDDLESSLPGAVPTKGLRDPAAPRPVSPLVVDDVVLVLVLVPVLAVVAAAAAAAAPLEARRDDFLGASFLS